jgi:hypothetical protein
MTSSGESVDNPDEPSEDEVRPLAVREDHEGGADWLWRTDADRLLQNPSPQFAAAIGAPKKS